MKKCEILVKVLNVVYDNRIVITKKMRKKRFKKKSLGVFRKYLTTKEYLYIKYFYAKFVKDDYLPKNNLRTFIKLLFKLNCLNIHFRDYYIGVKTKKKYKKITEKSYFNYDKRVVLDNIVVDIISKINVNKEK
jgi:hypothetical protein